MTRILAFAIVLTACSCAQQQIVPDAQQQIVAIKARYNAALATAHGICSPSCYDASAAIVTADSERTADAIKHARIAVETMERNREPVPRSTCRVAVG